MDNLLGRIWPYKRPVQRYYFDIKVHNKKHYLYLFLEIPFVNCGISRRVARPRKQLFGTLFDEDWGSLMFFDGKLYAYRYSQYGTINEVYKAVEKIEQEFINLAPGLFYDTVFISPNSAYSPRPSMSSAPD